MRNTLMTCSATAAAVALLLGIGMPTDPARAASVSITSVTGTWTSATSDPAGGVSGIGTSSISWGIPTTTGGPQSGYVFAGAAPPAFPVVANTPFQLGTFTHNNNPIFAPSLTAATLNVQINGSVDSTPFSATSIFSFTHNETPNNPTQQNPNCCDDIVTAITNPSGTTSVTVDNVAYVFAFSSFMVGDTPLSQFFTHEGQSNVASLFGSFIERSQIEPPSEVPIPAALPLFASGLGLLGLAGWRKRRKAAA